MNHFKINGVEHPSPISERIENQEGNPENTLGNLMAYVERELINEQSLLASIKVDGKVLSQTDEQMLATEPLSSLDTVEFNFIHPRELAEETLQSLKPYSTELAQLSVHISDRLWAGEDVDSDFRGLIDGLETFIESVNTSKSILRIHAGNTPSAVRVLEADLVTLLKDLLMAFESQKLEERVAILSEPIPANLIEWGLTGVDLLIRSRDS